MFDKISYLYSTICPFFVKKIYLFGSRPKYTQAIEMLRNALEDQIEFIEIRDREDDIVVSREINVWTLEEKFGGRMKNLQEYWPPRCLTDATKNLDDDALLEKQIVPFTYNASEFSTFVLTIKAMKPETDQITGARSQSQVNNNPCITFGEDLSTTNSLFDVNDIRLAKLRKDRLKRRRKKRVEEADSKVTDDADCYQIDEREEIDQSLTKNMSGLKARIIRKKTLDSLSSKRITQSGFTGKSSHLDSRSDIYVDAEPITKVREIPRFESEGDKRRSYFMKKGKLSNGFLGRKLGGTVVSGGVIGRSRIAPPEQIGNQGNDGSKAGRGIGRGLFNN